MSDKNVDPGQSASGSTGAPNQTHSGTSVAANSAIDAETLKTLEPLIDRLVDQRWRSFKDSRMAQHEGQLKEHSDRMSEFSKQLTRMQAYMSKGMSQDDALWRMEIEDRLPSTTQDAAPSSPAAAGNQPTAQVSAQVATILPAFRLQLNDPIVGEALRHSSDFAEQVQYIAKAVTEREAKTQVQPNPATFMPSGTGSSGSERTLETVENELSAIQRIPVSQRDMKKWRALSEEHIALMARK